MYYKLHLTLLLNLFVGLCTYAQSPYHELARDTIITRRIFLGNVYLLDGKKLNLEVMQWFMSEHPSAYDQIQVAVVADQAAAVSYTLGSLALLSGVLVGQDNEAAGRDLMLMGSGGIGGGLVFTLISGAYQRRAVSSYNNSIKQQYYKRKKINYSLQMKGGGVSIVGRW